MFSCTYSFFCIFRSCRNRRLHVKLRRPQVRRLGRCRPRRLLWVVLMPRRRRKTPPLLLIRRCSVSVLFISFFRFGLYWSVADTHPLCILWLLLLCWCLCPLGFNCKFFLRRFPPLGLCKTCYLWPFSKMVFILVVNCGNISIKVSLDLLLSRCLPS